MTAPVQEDLVELLDAIASDRIHTTDRERCVAAIRHDAQTHDGLIDQNRVRAALCHPLTGTLDVHPRVLSATYSWLRQRGAITRTGQFVRNTDRHGKNAGKPQELWAWTGEPA